MSRPSSLESLLPEVLAVVHEAIREGVSINETYRRMRAHGGDCSRSAVARYVKGVRDDLRRQREEDGRLDFWLGTLGDRPEGRAGRFAIEKLRSLAMRAAVALDKEKEPPSIEKIAALALAMLRIESAGKGGSGRESAIALDAARKGAGRADTREQQKGLSPRAVAHIRAAVEGYWGVETPEEPEE